MYHLGEPVYNSEYCGVTYRCRQASDKVHRDVGPRSLGHGKRTQQSRRFAGGGFTLSTVQTGGHKFTDILSQSGPPKPFLYSVAGLCYSRMVNEFGGMTSLQNLGA